MRFAYADPPYLGKCGKFYDHNHPDGRCWDDLLTHKLLIDRLLGDYPDDWRELGWCCRECGILAWYSMSPELRRELHPARSSPGLRQR